MGLLISQVAELKAERTVLLDRLAQIGLGGPLFHVPAQAELQEDEPAEEVVDPQAEIREMIANYGRRPSLLAQAIRAKAIKEQKLGGRGPGVARIPKIDEAFDNAEAEGRKQG